MNRQEIREQARSIAAATTSASFTTNVDRAEYHLTDAVRATLEDAARAVCPDCDRNATQGTSACSKAFRSDAEPPLRWAHYNDGVQWPCDAGPIHDLIAALESEEA